MQLTKTIKTLNDLIAFPTISTDTNLEMIEYLADILRELGADIQLSHDKDKRKANLFATIGPYVDGGIILSGHTDVVPVEGQEWSEDPFKMVEKDGYLYGRGTCDMKGFIACAVTAAEKYANAELKHPVHFAFTYDEEIGCLGAPVMLEKLKESGLKPSVCIIGEPTGMRVIEGHKGCCERTTRFGGLEGHGSVPGAGVNAVEYASYYISELMRIGTELQRRCPPESKFEPPWTTINIGRIQGGIAHNVIPNICELDWEFRPINAADKDFVQDQIAAYAQDVLLPEMQKTHPLSFIDNQVIADVDDLEPMPDSEAVALAQKLTGGNSAHLVPFGTEAGLFQAMGISAVVCGPGYIDQAHKPDEFVEVTQLESCLEMLDRLLPKLQG